MRSLYGIVFDGQVAYTPSKFERVFLVEDGWKISEDNEQGRVSLSCERLSIDITLWGYAYTLVWTRTADPEPAPGPKKARKS